MGRLFTLAQTNMPIYLYKCEQCQTKVERLLPIGGDAPICHGEGMRQVPTFPVMVKWKGEGGYPSRRKQWRGIAPNTVGYDSTTDPMSEFYKGEMHAKYYGQAARSEKLSSEVEMLEK